MASPGWCPDTIAGNRNVEPEAEIHLEDFREAPRAELPEP